MSFVAQPESDFSARKLKIAGVCLMGQLFGSGMLLMGPLAMLMVPMTKEFGWSRSRFYYSTSAVMWAGALASPIFGRFIDRLGVRPVVISGTFMIGLLSLALVRQTASLWLFYLLYALIGIIAGYVLSALLFLAIGRYRYTTDFKVIPS
jgi:MFS family permease